MKTVAIIAFSRSGYENLLGTPKRLLLRPSGNVMIVLEKEILNSMLRFILRSTEFEFLLVRWTGRSSGVVGSC